MFSRRVLTAASSLMLLSLAACSGAAADGSVPDDDGVPTANEPTGAAAGEKSGGAAGADGSVLDLGNVAAGASITFAVPAGTLGFSIVVDATAGAADSLGVEGLADPSGAAVVRDFRQVAEPHAPASGFNGFGVGVANIPFAGDQATHAVPSGTWTARLGGISGATKGATGSAWSGSVHASVRFQKSSDGAFHGGAMDLDLYIPEGLVVDAHPITATSAATDAALNARLDGMFGLLQRLYGLDRGTVRFHALPASALEVSGQSAVDATNRLASAVNAHPAAQVILTNRLSPDGDGSEISGVSNCLPGAVGLPGTSCSAVIVSLRDSSPAWEDATTIVHELGHFVGLTHTTEFGGDPDALSDTPACTDTTKSALASCPDHDNLMFPSVNLSDGEASIAVSATQKAIVRASPLYRAAR